MTSFIASWSNLRAKEEGSRVMESNGIVERAVQLVEGEERWVVRVGSVQAILPWITKYAGVLLSGFEVIGHGRQGNVSIDKSGRTVDDDGTSARRVGERVLFTYIPQALDGSSFSPEHTDHSRRRRTQDQHEHSHDR